jgi:hypothetical protein
MGNILVREGEPQPTKSGEKNVFSQSLYDLGILTDDSFINRAFRFIGSHVTRVFIFVFVFCLFVLNLTAVSVSLQCNKDADFFFKIGSAMFAFMFGIFYILVNYYLYRVNLNGYPCIICNTEIFKF